MGITEISIFACLEILGVFLLNCGYAINHSTLMALHGHYLPQMVRNSILI